MSELALRNLTPIPEDFTWLEISQAVELTGLNERSLRRKCAEEWLAQGKARTLREQGIRPRWQIRSDAHPSLNIQKAMVVSGKDVGELEQSLAIVAAKTNALALSGVGGVKARERAAIVASWQKHIAAASVLKITADAATTAFLADFEKNFPGLDKPTRATLYNWKNRKASGDGIDGLIDGRSVKSATIHATRDGDPFLACVKRLWATQNKRGLDVCYQAAVLFAQQNGWPIQSKSVTSRFIESMDRREKIWKRKGDEAFTNEVLPHLERDYTTGNSNDQWVADHHQFDVWVKTGTKFDPTTGKSKIIYNRPFLTAWMDMRSRKITGWEIRWQAPNVDVILAALFNGCVSHYVPDDVYSDNGKDFDNQILTGETKAQRRKRLKNGGNDSVRLAGVYAALGVTHTHARPYHPQSKTIERFFGTVCERFSKLWETYCGNSPENRPEGVEERKERGLGPDMEEFIAAFAAWLDADYHKRIHTGHGMDDTPENVWAANLKKPRTISRENLELLMQPRFEVKVDQLGVRKDGLTYGRFVLNPYIGQRVYIRVNNADVTSVSVWTADDKFICFAPCNERVPMKSTSQDVRDANRMINRFAKQRREEWRQPRLAMAMVGGGLGGGAVPSLMIAAAVEKAQATGLDRPALPAPESFRPVRSDLESKVNHIRLVREEERHELPAATDDTSTQLHASGVMSIDEMLNAYGGDTHE